MLSRSGDGALSLQSDLLGLGEQHLRALLALQERQERPSRIRLLLLKGAGAWACRYLPLLQAHLQVAHDRRAWDGGLTQVPTVTPLFCPLLLLVDQVRAR